MCGTNLRVAHGETGQWSEEDEAGAIYAAGPASGWHEAEEVYIPPLYFGNHDSDHDWALMKLATSVAGVPTATLTGELADGPQDLRLESAQGSARFLDWGAPNPTSSPGTMDDRDKNTNPSFRLSFLPGVAHPGDSGGGIYNTDVSPATVYGAMSLIQGGAAVSVNGATNLMFWRGWVGPMFRNLRDDIPALCTPRFTFKTPEVPSPGTDQVRDQVRDVGCLEYRDGAYIGRMYDDDGQDLVELALSLSDADFPATTHPLMEDDFFGGTTDRAQAGFAIASGEKVVIVQPGRTDLEIDLEDIDPGSTPAWRDVELFAFNLDFVAGKELVVGVNGKYRAYRIRDAGATPNAPPNVTAVHPGYFNHDNAQDMLLLHQDGETLWLRVIRDGVSRNNSLNAFIPGNYDLSDMTLIASLFSRIPVRLQNGEPERCSWFLMATPLFTASTRMARWIHLGTRGHTSGSRSSIQPKILGQVFPCSGEPLM